MECSSCKKVMQSLGQVPVRVGGETGAWNLLFHELAVADETVWPLEVYRCPVCKRVELFDVEMSLPAK